MPETQAVKISTEELKDAIRAEYIEGCMTGRHWHFVRVWPDGSVSHGAEASPCYPESEYYRKGHPYPRTVWSERFSESANGPDDRVFEWEACSPDEEPEFWINPAGTEWECEPSEEFPIPARMTSTLIEDLDWDMILTDVERDLTEAGYELAD